MYRKYLWQVLSLLVLLTLVSYRPARAAEPVLDLSQDANHDGIPDELYRQVQTVPLAGDPQAAIAHLVWQLPYAPHTRTLQQEAADLYFQLALTQLLGGAPLTDAQVQRLTAQLAELQNQMLADPNYALVQRALAALLAEAGAAQAVGGGLNWRALRRGDILLTRSGRTPWTTGIFAMWYDHAGLYDGNGWVYEANPGGLRRRPLSAWQQPGRYVALGRVTGNVQAQVVQALDRAERAYGVTGQTPYNYAYPNKWAADRLYCSQLVWDVYMQAGVDVDSNAWAYELWLAAKWGDWAVTALAQPAVAPDEIALSPRLTLYSQGWTGAKG